MLDKTLNDFNDNITTRKWYDERGLLIHSIRSDGSKSWHEYDEKGRVIHTKNSNGSERWFGANGGLTHVKSSSGYEGWYEYDEKGRLIHAKDSHGGRKSYGEYGREIATSVDFGNLLFYEYDKNDNVVSLSKFTGLNEWDNNSLQFISDQSNEFDGNNLLVHCRYSDGLEKWFNYDKKGHVIHIKHSNGYEQWVEYDENGQVLQSKDSENVVKRFALDRANEEAYKRLVSRSEAKARESIIDGRNQSSAPPLKRL